MQEYDIKKNHPIDERKLKEIMQSCFGTLKEENCRFISTYGALDKVIAYLDKNKLCVHTIMKKEVDNKTAEETIKKYNNFLEESTGFTAKERVDRIKKKMKSEKKR